jgi:endoglucanase
VVADLPADLGAALQPHDPTGNMIASVHVYSFNTCSTLQCYGGAMKQVSAHVPLLIGELGPDLTVPYTPELDNSCPATDVGSTPFDSTLLTWALANRVSWTAWSWNPWGDCWSLIKDFGGTPAGQYGAIIKTALLRQRQKAAA